MTATGFSNNWSHLRIALFRMMPCPEGRDR
jgi:hypothetical protein